MKHLIPWHPEGARVWAAVSRQGRGGAAPGTTVAGHHAIYTRPKGSPPPASACLEREFRRKEARTVDCRHLRCVGFRRAGSAISAWTGLQNVRDLSYSGIGLRLNDGPLAPDSASALRTFSEWWLISESARLDFSKLASRPVAQAYARVCRYGTRLPVVGSMWRGGKGKDEGKGEYSWLALDRNLDPTVLHILDDAMHPATSTRSLRRHGLFELLFAGAYGGRAAFGVVGPFRGRGFPECLRGLEAHYEQLVAGPYAPPSVGVGGYEYYWVPKWASAYHRNFDAVADRLDDNPRLGHIASALVSRVHKHRVGAGVRVQPKAGTTAERTLSTICFAAWGGICTGHQIGAETVPHLTSLTELSVKNPTTGRSVPRQWSDVDSKGPTRSWVGCVSTDQALSRLRGGIQMRTQLHGWDRALYLSRTHYIIGFCNPAHARVHSFRQAIETWGGRRSAEEGSCRAVDMWRLAVRRRRLELDGVMEALGLELKQVGHGGDWEPDELVTKTEAEYRAVGSRLGELGYSTLQRAGMRLLSKEEVEELDQQTSVLRRAGLSPQPASTSEEHPLVQTLSLADGKADAHLRRAGLYMTRRLFSVFCSHKKTGTRVRVAAGVAFAATTGFNLFGVLDRVHLFWLDDAGFSAEAAEERRDTAFVAIVENARRWLEDGPARELLQHARGATPIPVVDKQVMSVVVDIDNLCRPPRVVPRAARPSPSETVMGSVEAVMEAVDQSSVGNALVGLTSRLKQPDYGGWRPDFLEKFARVDGRGPKPFEGPPLLVHEGIGFFMVIRRRFATELVESQLAYAP